MKVPNKTIPVILSLCLSFLGVQAQTVIRYYNHSGVAGSYGLGNVRYMVNDKESIRKNDQWSVDVFTVNGIHIKNHGLGIGVGGDIWKNRWFIPVYLNYSFAFMDKKVSPYGSFDLGYAFGKVKGDFFTGDERGAILVRPNFGVQVKLTNRLCFVSQIFYKLQTIRTDYASGGVPVPGSEITRTGYFVYYHFLGLNVGLKL